MKKNDKLFKLKDSNFRESFMEKCIKLAELFKKNWKLIILVLTVIVFFSTILILCYDSAHYLIFVEIFEGKRPFSDWDVVRGPVFPYIIYWSTRLFGRTAMGILIMFYLFYLIFCYCASKLLDRLIINNKYKFLVKTLLLMYLIFNPLVLGYYHTLLTENVAMTIMIISCFVAWKWQFVRDNKFRVLFSIYFVIMATIAYFLKQPYIYTVVVPMIIAIAYALLNNRTFKNVRYYCGTFLILVFVLACSIFGWNKFLIHKGVTMQHDRMADGMLSHQVLTGSSHISLSRVENYNDVKNDKYLSLSEKKIINKRAANGLGTIIVTLTNMKNKPVTKNIIKADALDEVGMADSLVNLTKMYFTHPLIITSAYAKNYCAMSSVCEIGMGENGLYITDNINWLSMYENNAIAYKTFTEWGSFYYLSEDGEIRASDFRQISHLGSVSRTIGDYSVITNVAYKIAVLSLPIIVIFMVILGLATKKKLTEVQVNIYKLSMLLLLSAFICYIANTFVGLMIDRYAAFAFPIIVLGYIGVVSFVFTLIPGHRKNKMVE